MRQYHVYATWFSFRREARAPMTLCTREKPCCKSASTAGSWMGAWLKSPSRSQGKPPWPLIFWWAHSTKAFAEFGSWTCPYNSAASKRKEPTRSKRNALQCPPTTVELCDLALPQLPSHKCAKMVLNGSTPFGLLGGISEAALSSADQ
eukprot:2041365-Amphidinium_carterae.1